MSATITLSHDQLEQLADAVAIRIRAGAVVPEVVAVDDAAFLVGTVGKTRRATQKALKRLGVRQYSRGKYRVADIRERIARRSRA